MLLLLTSDEGSLCHSSTRYSSKIRSARRGYSRKTKRDSVTWSATNGTGTVPLDRRRVMSKVSVRSAGTDENPKLIEE